MGFLVVDGTGRDCGKYKQDQAAADTLAPWDTVFARAEGHPNWQV